MAFLDGAPPERLCQPLVDYFTAKGGQVQMNARLKDIELNPDGSVKQLQLVNGETVSSRVLACMMSNARQQVLAKAVNGVFTCRQHPFRCMLSSVCMILHCRAQHSSARHPLARAIACVAQVCLPCSQLCVYALLMLLM